MSRNVFLSVIMVARNDDYGGHFIERLHLSLFSLLNNIKYKKIKTEIIIVEWNPPKNKPLLKDILNIQSTKDVTIKILTISSKTHDSINSFRNKKVHEYYAKNVGIRRSRGKWVLCTNPDIIFSKELIDSIDPVLLDDKVFYRAIRYDVKQPNYKLVKPDGILKYCQKNVLRILNQDYSEHPTLFKIFPTFIQIYRYYLFCKRRLSIFPFEIPFTKAAGDFLLMSKKQWNIIRGYPEIEGWYEIDGIPSYQALFLGLNQKVYSYPSVIYHIDHNRLKYSADIRSPKVNSIYEKLLNKRKFYKLNKEDWGLNKLKLKHIWL